MYYVINDMAYKKQATFKEYTIRVRCNNSIEVLVDGKLYDKAVKPFLRDIIAQQVGLTVEEKWNTQVLGSKLVDYIRSINESEIVLSRMYTGKYLYYNIGHEVINLFKADDGKHYIYLNDIGTFGEKHIDKNTGELLFDNIILTKPIGHNAVEVVGWASGLKMIYNPMKDDDYNKGRQNKAREIKYGGQKLRDIFCDLDQKNENIVVTFLAKKVLIPKESICIVYAQKKSQENTFHFEADYKKVVQLTEKSLGRDLRTYIIRPDKNIEKSDFKKIKTIIDQKGLWIDKTEKVSTKKIKYPIFLEICRRNYDEIAYSNIIHYLLVNYPKLQQPFLEFLKEKNHSVPVIDSFEIYREYHPQSENKKSSSPIDLLIKHGDYRIIIENKLKAEIGALKKDSDGNQLTRYVTELENIEGINKDNIFCFLLTPEYHKIDLSKLSVNDEKLKCIIEKYIALTYKNIFEFFKSNKTIFKDDPYNDEFLRALELHASETDDFNYRTMMRRLGRRINLGKKQT